MTESDSETTYLLGAGASIEAGVPGSQGMVEAIYNALRDDDREVLRVAMAGVRANRIVVDEEPFSEIDIEELYATLNLLADRHTSPLAPFVGAWSYNVQAVDHPSVNWDVTSVGRALTHLLEQGGEGYGLRSPSTSTFERALQDALQRSDETGTVFSVAAGNVVRALLKLSHVSDSERVKYLAPIVASSRLRPLWIASLNYDNAIELCARKAGVPVDVGVFKTPLDFSPDSAIILIKLHGSVDWQLEQDWTIAPCSSPPPFNPVLVFGAGNKLQIEGPFLDLLFALRARLERTERLNVCGYSFRDDHVNHLIRTWLRGSTKRILSVSDPSLTGPAIARRIMGRRLGSVIALAESAQLVVRQEAASEWARQEFQEGKG